MADPHVSGGGLTLPGAVQTTALDLPEDLSFDRWREAGQVLARIEEACQWWIGDWLNYGERRYGERYLEAARITGRSAQGLEDIAYVARQVEISRRRENLKFSHHREVAPLAPDEQALFLDHAAARGWTVQRLRQELRAAEQHETPTGRQPLDGPVEPVLVTCPGCGLVFTP